MKNISRNKTIKWILFILTVILITAALVQIQYVLYLDTDFESLFVKEYKDSQHFYDYDLQMSVAQITYLIENNSDSEELPQDLNCYYYASDGEAIFSNAPKQEKDFFKQHEFFYIFEDGKWSGRKNIDEQMMHYSNSLDQKDIIYIAFPDKYMEMQQREWKEKSDLLLPFAISIITCILLALIFIIYLINVTGRKPEDEKLHLSRIDYIYSDVLFMGFMIPISLWLITGSTIFYSFGSSIGEISIDNIYSMIILGIITAIVTIISGITLLSMVRKIKAEKFIKHSLLYRIFFQVKDFFKGLFDGRMFERYPLTKALFYRQLVFIIGSAILVFFTFLFLIFPPLILIPIALEAVIIYWYIKYNNKTYEDINKGFNESLEEQMKSERMKIDLVTNVSHDLKTPLTSIVSYIDLLSKEEDLSQSAKDYIDILSDKSNRLTQIVSGLFDLAKSTSGNINLKLEKLDLKKLIEQTLGDMKDEIERSDLQIKANLPEKGLYIVSDGEKMYRVFQNIIDNALRYSLNGTRIYIDAEDINGKAVATIKNIANYEMDFTADEILQRFNRGDGSRTTDGSGLGLSIAESFSNVCGGDFEVDIDGDLFKVTIKFDIEKK